jgi:peptidoglycan/xylan/chitin deacetylase (PgdA/CDA1 family)
MTWVAPALLAAVAAYAVGHWALWDLWGRLDPSTLRRTAVGARGVALTFDDGPGEATERLLTVLEELGVRATFFVVAERAQKRPDVVRRMLAAGHEVAYHGPVHRHAALWAPWGGQAAMEEGWRVLKEVTQGGAAPFFRPPHGALNLPLRRAARALGLRVVLWSQDPKDYRGQLSPQDLARRVAQHVRDGDVVDLHDAGGAPGAPWRTVQALPAMVEGLRRRGLRPMPLGELLARAGEEPTSVRVRLWELWEEVFSRLFPTTPVGPYGLLGISPRPYRGPRLVAPSGRVVEPGTWGGEIHLGNYAISRLAGGAKESFRILRMLEETMEDLRARVRAGEFPGVEVFFGTTLLGRAAGLLGLHAQDVPSTLGVRANTAYMRLLLRIYHPRGAWRLRQHPQGLRPMLCWITREELVAFTPRDGKKAGALTGRVAAARHGLPENSQGEDELSDP